MKPELQAIHAAVLSQFNLPENVVSDVAQTILLAALHWRGDELWFVTWRIGGVSKWLRPTERWSYFFDETILGFHPTQDDARDALMSAAQDQINAWFKE